MELGGPPRVTDYRSWVQGVAAQTPQQRAVGIPRIAAKAAQGIDTLMERARGRDAPINKRYGTLNSYPRTLPHIRMGPIPKLATGSGLTAAQPGIALGATPGGYTPPQQIFVAGMENIPYLRENFDSSMTPRTKEAPGGFPRHGVGATSGTEFIPTYRAHDWVWADRFSKHGRMPGPWQETSFPGYRALQPIQHPRKYNLYNNVALARPMSPSTYFLGYQTPIDTASRIGGGVGRPLGY